MEGFGPVENGYVDVEDQLARYLRTEAADHLAVERDEKRGESTPGASPRRTESARRGLLAALDGRNLGSLRVEWSDDSS